MHHADRTVGADIVAASFGGGGVLTGRDDALDRVGTVGGRDIEPAPASESAVTSEPGSQDGNQVDDGLPQINLVKINIGDMSPGESVEETAVGAIGGPAPSEVDKPVVLDQDAISALFAAAEEDDKAA